MLVARPPGKIAVDETAAILRYGNLEPSQLELLDLDQASLDLPDLSQYSGVIITGSPYNYLSSTKSDSQKRTEENVLSACEELLGRDFPTLGLCYGLQMLAVASGAHLTNRFAEPMGAHSISLNASGTRDPISSALPETFYSYAAHSEALEDIPPGMEVLASSPTTPIHIGKFGTNIYGTQHHPEIGRDGIALRISHYVGVYFSQEEYEDVLRSCLAVRVEHGLITKFANTYRR